MARITKNRKKSIEMYDAEKYYSLEDASKIIKKFSKLKFNQDFFCGYSPERINPGDKKHTITNIKKITSGSTPEIADLVDNLYSEIINAGTFKVSSIKIAEAAKVIENTQRDLNIALINELSMLFNKLNLDTQEVLKAAGTKWNFLPFKPGLVGGHCIGVDPYYLTYKAEKMGYKPNLILSSRIINNGMSAYIAKKTIRFLVDYDKNIKGSKILVLGLTFKENCPDIRNTKVLDIIDELDWSPLAHSPHYDFYPVKQKFEEVKAEADNQISIQNAS